MRLGDLVPTEQAMARIRAMKRDRWEKGRKEYRPDPLMGFQGDPAQEALDEMIDGLNYLDVLRSHRTDVPLWALNTLENNLLQAALILLEFK